MRTFRGWLREPLLHFVVLGAALCAVYRWAAPAPTAQIVLSPSVIQGLRQDHLRRTGSVPTREEEDGLIQRFVDDEVLYREAVAQGLDRGDVIVRRRLVQKMEFVLENLQPPVAPTDAELRTYAAAHSERYSVPARVALSHVFLSSDRHPADAELLAEQLRQAVLRGADPSTLGDPFLRGREFSLHSEQEIATIFGASFAAQIMQLPADQWSAPIRSSYGVHLVRVTQRQAATPPDDTTLRTTALRDWQEEQRAAASRAALARLRQRYDVQIASAQRPRDQVAQAR